MSSSSICVHARECTRRFNRTCASPATTLTVIERLQLASQLLIMVSRTHLLIVMVIPWSQHKAACGRKRVMATAVAHSAPPVNTLGVHMDG